MVSLSFRQVVEEWIHARYKTIGVAEGTTHINETEIAHVVSEDMGHVGWIVGMWAHLISRSRGSISFNGADPDFFEKLKEVLDSYENPDV